MALGECDSWGAINYAVTTLVAKYMHNKSKDHFDRLHYIDLQTAQGLFSCAAEEFYRRIVVPFEDMMKHENGDVEIYEEILRGMGDHR